MEGSDKMVDRLVGKKGNLETSQPRMIFEIQVNSRRKLGGFPSPLSVRYARYAEGWLKGNHKETFAT